MKMIKLFKKAVVTIISIIFAVSAFTVTSYATVPTATVMRERINSAKASPQFREGTIYDQYKCPRCVSEPYYAAQCYGFSVALADYLFGGDECTHKWPTHRNIDLLCVGNIVRINNDTHSIVITDINGDTITYVDGNGKNDLKIHWDHTISRSALAGKMTYIRSNPQNELFSLDVTSLPVPVPTPVPVPISDGSTYIINSVSNGKPLNCLVWDINDVADFTKVNTYDRYEGDPAQRFTIESYNGAYNLKTQKDGYLVNIMSRYNSGAQAIAYNRNKDIESWIFTSCGSGYAIVLNSNPTMALTVGPDGNVTLQPYTGSSNQQWTFEAV